MPKVKTFLATATLILLVTGLCSAAEYWHQGDIVLNDLKATPGDADKKACGARALFSFVQNRGARTR